MPRPAATPPAPQPVPRAVRQTMGGLLGAVSLELFGHLHNAIEDYPTWFAHQAQRLCPV